MDSSQNSDSEIPQQDTSSVIYDDDEENPNDYKPGGYHPVQLNEIFLNRYIVVQKLGWGHFSTVWLCKDIKYNTYVAMKVQKSAPHYTEAAYDEIDILLKVSGNIDNNVWLTSLQRYFAGQPEADEIRKKENLQNICYVVQLLNSFLHYGPHGKHVCMVFEILGVNLLDVIKRYNYKGVPIPLCRIISKQVLIGLDYLHRICGIIHTDLKPENVLLQLTKAQLNEIITHGMLKDRGNAAPITPIKQITQTLTDIPKQMPNQQLSKKEKQKLRKKKQKQRKKEQVIQEESQTSTQATKKRRKRNRNKNKKNNNESQNVPTMEDLPESNDNPPEFLDAEEDVPDFMQDSPSQEKPEFKFPFKKSLTPNLNAGESRDLNSIVKSTHQVLQKLDESIQVKIADLGNACWVDNHFSTEIQTRQYRSPEVILGVTYNYTADIWSFACMLFELIVGDFLFEPKTGKGFDKDDDHLAQMIETLGLFDKDWALSGRYSKKFFNKYGVLKKVKKLRFWHLRDVLIEKYRFVPQQAEELTQFLLPMLRFKPEKRQTAQEALSSPWLISKEVQQYRQTDEEYQQYMEKKEIAMQIQSFKIERGEIPSSPEIPQDLSDEDASSEDNALDTDDESMLSFEEGQAREFVENMNYHKEMRRMRKELVGDVSSDLE